MKRLVAVVALLLSIAAPSEAQQTLLDTCSRPPAYTPDVRADLMANEQTAQLVTDIEDAFQTACAAGAGLLIGMQPGIGMAVSGGNPTLGTGTTIGTRLGLLPRVSASAQLNVAGLSTSSVPFASLQGNVAVGVFNGLQLAPLIGGVGSIDLLGSVSWVPLTWLGSASETFDSFDVPIAIATEDNMLAGGLGARVGLLKQGITVPGISVSGMYRRAFTGLDIGFSAPDVLPGAQIDIDSDISALNLRAIISKGFLFMDFALGGGYDRYTSSEAGFDVTFTCDRDECRQAREALTGESGPITLAGGASDAFSTSTWNWFFDAGFSLLLLNVVLEVGQQFPAPDLTAESFAEFPGVEEELNLSPADLLEGGRWFGSLGVRLQI